MKMDAAERLSEAPESEKGRAHTKVLGVNWIANDDTFTFDLSELSFMAVDLQPTKRNVVSLMAACTTPYLLSPSDSRHSFRGCVKHE